MRTCAVLVLVAALAPDASAQPPGLPPVAYPPIPEVAQRIVDFVPAGWRLEHAAHGRLDADDRDDALLVLRMENHGNIVQNEGFGPDRFDTNPRMLVAAFAVEGGYRRALVDHALIPRPEVPVFDDYLQDDPAAAIEIHPNRSVSVRLHSWASAGSWQTRQVRFTFRHQDGCFRLVGYDDHEMHRGSMERRETSVNYLTGRAWVETGSMEHAAAGPRRWSRLDPNPVVCIGEVGNGFEYRPPVEAD
ncbi:hypothetical protein QFW77_13875 [Luteimonas sp. RD2P54]|uniref:Uncharacterized protein n=1 Tax=Luteimonas endophytica TaxID=3042023 RepID=A0ABT6JB59_9GAMM|nr:hypothetical protein [Luteimonas endophytica]MDH5824067.1 hypothetical protein [Luteimonas endophytica]